MPEIQPTSSAIYRRIEELPEGLTGEILDGQVHAQSRPSMPHGLVGSVLGSELVGPFHKGKGGPGGWWIIHEPEIHFLHDIAVAVPDLAGWRREHMPKLPTGHRVEVVPDWICEVLSPSTVSRDREVKLPLYAQYGVQYTWVIDPATRILEVYQLDAGAWIEIGRFTGTDQVAVPPFEAISIDLKGCWAD